MKKVLFVGSHTDDIEHGAGGLLAKCIANPDIQVSYVTMSRCLDLERNEKLALDQERVKEYFNSIGVSCSMLDFPNRLLSTVSLLIRQELENIRDKFNPTLVVSHWMGDIHQDHKYLAEEVARVFRNHSVLGYQVLRSCPRFSPNYYVKLTEKELEQKIQLVNMFETQTTLYYNKPESIRGCACMRGVEIGCEFAEAYFTDRMIGEF
jgi:LmbE family N-acetylglucosaminyl deacetylase